MNKGVLAKPTELCRAGERLCTGLESRKDDGSATPPTYVIQSKILFIFQMAHLHACKI